MANVIDLALSFQGINQGKGAKQKNTWKRVVKIVVIIVLCLLTVWFMNAFVRVLKDFAAAVTP